MATGRVAATKFGPTFGRLELELDADGREEAEPELSTGFEILTLAPKTGLTFIGSGAGGQRPLEAAVACCRAGTDALKHGIKGFEVTSGVA